MLDIQYVRHHPEEVAANCLRRRVKADVKRCLELYEEKNRIQTELDLARRRANEVSKSMKGKMESEAREKLIAEGRDLKKKEEELRLAFDRAKEALEAEWIRLPNRTHPAVPVGETDKDNPEVRRWGEPRKFSFRPRDHVDLGRSLDVIDFEAGGRVAGSAFYFLKNEGVLLELALVRLALDRLREEGFDLYQTPDVARPKILEGIGFNPRGEESQVYSLAGHDLCLIGTAEITLGGLHADEILEASRLPMRIAGLSHCFRTEAGSHGRESKGLYRVHQFTKVEMFAFTRPEESEAMLESLVGIEESIFQRLEIPYRVVDTCAGDLGGPAYRKYDVEAWMPGRGAGGEWGEVTSASNCTDYQARRLNIRFRPTKDAKPEFAHMLNGTAIAVSRGLLSLLENHQEPDGSVRIPKALVGYTGFERITPRR